jgi:GntR family transcriptional regulator
MKDDTAPTPPAFFNPFPKYLQVRHMLERRLYGQCEIGDKLPTEQALCEEFGVSRETVREALRGLEEAGVIRRYRAKGTFFVSRPDLPTAPRMTDLVEDTGTSTRSHAEILSAGPAKPPHELLPDLGEACNIHLIERLYHLDDRPLALHQCYLPGAVAEGILPFDLTGIRLVEAIEARLGLPCLEERQYIEAMVADTRLARLLDIPVGAPVLKIMRAYRLGRQDLGEGPALRALFRSYYRADRYTYAVEFKPAR